ncbi:MAG: hypothetical protein IJ710_07215 [Prevotella sp.]|nr:hypothetical protein [Prevotella sp.]
MANQEQRCRINPQEETIPDVGLGTFVTGYKTDPNQNWQALAISLVGTVLFGFWALHIFKDDDTHNDYWGWITAVVAVFFLYRFGIALYRQFGAAHCIEKAFIYQNGFVWDWQKKDGTTVNRKVINFDEVAAIEFPRTKHYTNGGYTRTDYQFEVLNHQNERLFACTGVYFSEDNNTDEMEWEAIALTCIRLQWEKVHPAPHSHS